MGKQGNKQVNRRLYECSDCKTRRMISWVELNRAARPKCYGCGSTRLELVSEKAKVDQARLQRERVSGAGGSLILAKNLEDNEHKRIT